MILREICTEPLSEWEECFIATYYLKGLEISGHALEEERKERMVRCLNLLQTLPKQIAREMCFEVLVHAETYNRKSR
jgi:hypothetical protein